MISLLDIKEMRLYLKSICLNANTFDYKFNDVVHPANKVEQWKARLDYDFLSAEQTKLH